MALHEALLASPFRTLDPEAADFFYVPAYTGCFVSEFNRPYPKHWLCDGCHKKGAAADLASVRAMRSSEATLNFISRLYPFWNRSGGADHLWPFFHDEGGCYAPAALRRALLLTHWGRAQPRPNGSSEYHLWRVRPHARRMYGWRRCYDPCKDLVLPSWRAPESFARSPHLLKAADRPRRERLFYFNGNLGRTKLLENYSFGLRQQLAALHAPREGVTVTDEKTPRYGEELSSSVFCGVLPGWGWSGRMEDAVLHGCIPVVLQDGIETPWERTLNLSEYGLRVPRRRMRSLVAELRAVPRWRVAQLQRGLHAAWQRFTYLGNVVAERKRREAKRLGPPPSATLVELAKRDAIATLVDALRARLELRRRRRQGSSPGSPPSSTEPAPGCVADPFGGDISPDPSWPPEIAGAREDGFENRLINGWVI